MKESAFVKDTVVFSKKLDSHIVKKIFVFDTLDSTNAKAKEFACAGAEDRTFVLARVQTHGRGRLDRTWQSPAGGMYLSVLLRPTITTEKTSLLSFVAALAVTTTLESYGLHAAIKWPNDVRVGGKKIAGVLLESEITGTTTDYVIVGMGINVNTAITHLSDDLQACSTSMMQELSGPVEYHRFLQTLLTMFDHYYMLFTHERYKQIMNEWKHHADTLGKQVQVQTSAETLQGTAYDIDESGFLLLKTDNGEIKKIISGDCRYLTEV
jgi:BirA family biotin operon repressor/biotin-[acetyl-CoA-carboxylase] ligase